MNEIKEVLTDCNNCNNCIYFEGFDECQDIFNCKLTHSYRSTDDVCIMFFDIDEAISIIEKARKLQ